MTTDRELMQMALDALMRLEQDTFHPAKVFPYKPAIIALRARLAQPEPEPVGELILGGVIDTSDGSEYEEWDIELSNKAIEALQEKLVTSDSVTLNIYTAPPQREWQGLTDEEMLVAAFKAGFDVHEDYGNEDDFDALHWWSEDGEQCDDTLYKLRDIIEAKLKEKNT